MAAGLGDRHRSVIANVILERRPQQAILAPESPRQEPQLAHGVAGAAVLDRSRQLGKLLAIQIAAPCALRQLLDGGDVFVDVGRDDVGNLRAAPVNGTVLTY